MIVGRGIPCRVVFAARCAFRAVEINRKVETVETVETVDSWDS